MNNYIGFIGGGNMASAICLGMINKGVCKANEIWVSGHHLENLQHLHTIGINVTNDNGDVIRNCTVIFLSIKPHNLVEAIEDCVMSVKRDEQNMLCAKNKLFISILAGTSLFRLEQALSVFQPCRIIRVMPNTPMLLGEGASVYTPGDSASEADCALLERILSCCGIYEKVPETLINAIGGLSGSGPAFAYMMIEALSDGGVKQGIPRAMAVKFAAQTVLGAAKMVLNTNKHPGQLKDEVCSAGGSTICGVHALEKGGIRGSFIDAVEAAVKRSIAMSNEN